VENFLQRQALIKGSKFGKKLKLKMIKKCIDVQELLYQVMTGVGQYRGLTKHNANLKLLRHRPNKQNNKLNKLQHPIFQSKQMKL
jgi:hypothetical protein